MSREHSGRKQVVLLTGATGLIGRQCIPHLLRAHCDVHAITRGELPAATDGVTWHAADILQPGEVDQLLDAIAPSHLLHTAWCAAGPGWASPENVRWTEASYRLLQAFTDRGGDRAVAAGSCAEYDWSFDRYAESVPLRPKTVYGQSKAALYEKAMELAAKTGLSVAWARIFFVYGPDEQPSRLVASAARSMLRGEPALCSQGLQVRDWLHSSDVAGALVTLLLARATGAMNIGAGEGHSVREVVSMLAEQIGRADLPVFGALPTGPDDPPSIVADVSRLSGEVGWHPQFDLRSGLADTINAWRRRMKGTTFT